MSEATKLNIAPLPATSDTPIRTGRSGYQCLTDIQKRAIITAIAAGASQLQLARQYRVNPSTIWRVKKSFIESTPGTVLDSGWRSKLHDTLPSKCVDALEASIDDREDVHKAAVTATNVMKGLGHLAGDSQVNVTIQTMLSGVPPEWRDELVLNTPTCSEVMPGNGAIEKAETRDPIES